MRKKIKKIKLKKRIGSNSFYKGYPNRKDHRKPYRDTRRFTSGCRHGGSCCRCIEGRLYNTFKGLERAYYSLEEYIDGG